MYNIYQNRVAAFAYGKFKRAYEIKEAEMFKMVVAERNATIEKFKKDLEKLRPDLQIRKDSGYITIYSKAFPCKYLKGFKEICSFGMDNNTVNFRRKAASHVTKQIKFRKELTPEKLIQYVERFSEK
jgi:hypothetical protein